MSDKELTQVRHRPCSTCPYARDCPSGVWHESEYAKLPPYDGTTTEQAEAGVFRLFFCHTTPDRLCAGWVGCHDMEESLAVRLHYCTIDPAIHDYVSPVPLFASGAEAAAHGMREIEAPDPEALAKLERIVEARRDKEEFIGLGYLRVST